MFQLIDRLTNKITMYRLVIYCLLALLTTAVGLSIFHLLPYQPLDIIATTVFLLAVCFVVNYIFAWVYQAPSNVESVYITALILALIISPIAVADNVALLVWAAVLAMASKYVLAWHKKALFNPAALAVTVTALTMGQAASWWVSNTYLLPVAAVAAIFIARKVKRFDLVLSFLAATVLVSAIFDWENVTQAMLYSPILFFAGVMLTEPITTPPTRGLRIWYGSIVGVLFAPVVHFGALYSTPELALVLGNIFSFIVSPKQKILMKFERKELMAENSYDFVFSTTQHFTFKAGQYVEWTLDHDRFDHRGLRRYFTIASSPSESELRFGIKLYEPASTFKQALSQLQPGQVVAAGQLAGDFTLPVNPQQPLVFIAGGVGITPFRSMIKCMLDTKQQRQVTLFYSNGHAQDIMYQDIFTQAQQQFGMKTVYTLTDRNNVPADWPHYIGYVTPHLIQTEVPNYLHSLFYISGSHAMVENFRRVLKQLGVPARQIKTDYFPGLA